MATATQNFDVQIMLHSSGSSRSMTATVKYKVRMLLRTRRGWFTLNDAFTDLNDFKKSFNKAPADLLPGEYRAAVNRFDFELTRLKKLALNA